MFPRGLFRVDHFGAFNLIFRTFLRPIFIHFLVNLFLFFRQNVSNIKIELIMVSFSFYFVYFVLFHFYLF